MEKTFQDLVQNSKSTLIVLPKNPFFDQVAAGLGLYLGLKSKGDTSITGSSQMTVEFNRLVGVDKISQEVGNKNLVIRFSDYAADSIERVSYDIEGSEFKLTVIPKPQVIPPSQDQIKVTYSGLSVDTVFLIGGANESHFPQLGSKEFAGAKIAHIGVQNLSAQGDVISLSKTSSSVSEIVAELLKGADLKIDQDTATNLLAGIYDGSKNFSSSYVSENTFRMAAELKSIGASDANKDRIDGRDFPQGAIPEVAKPATPVESQPQVEPWDNQNNTAAPAIAIPKQPAATTPPKSWLEPKILKSS